MKIDLTTAQINIVKNSLVLAVEEINNKPYSKKNTKDLEEIWSLFNLLLNLSEDS